MPESSGETVHRLVDVLTGCGEQCECGHISPTVEAHEAHVRQMLGVRDDPWREGFRHCMSDLTETPEGHVWTCKWCRQDFSEWPSDTLACPGPDAHCPRCRSKVIEHPWSHFADVTGEHPWVCGRCYGDDHPGSESVVVDPEGGHFGGQS